MHWFDFFCLSSAPIKLNDVTFSQTQPTRVQQQPQQQQQQQEQQQQQQQQLQLQQLVLDPLRARIFPELEQKIEKEIQLDFEQKLSNKKVAKKSSTETEMANEDLDEISPDKSESKG